MQSKQLQKRPIEPRSFEVHPLHAVLGVLRATAEPSLRTRADRFDETEVEEFGTSQNAEVPASKLVSRGLVDLGKGSKPAIECHSQNAYYIEVPARK